MTKCQWCEKDHGLICPEIKAIEYHPDGMVKRVEFMTFADKMYPFLVPQPLPVYPSQPPIPTYPYYGPTFRVSTDFHT
jgi:hypothetical protein